MQHVLVEAVENNMLNVLPGRVFNKFVYNHNVRQLPNAARVFARKLGLSASLIPTGAGSPEGSRNEL